MPSSKPGSASAAPLAVPLLDRDHSILAFNARVLHWATRPRVPLLERLRFLCIVSSNLDEFFEVRADPHVAAWRANDRKGAHSVASLEALATRTQALVAQQYAIYNDLLTPALARQGIRVVPHGERDAAQRRWVRSYFQREVRPLLVPVGLDPAHPFPQVANKSLNFIVQLGGRDAFGRDNDIAIVKVPRVLPRMIRLPASVSGGQALCVSLSSVIRSHLQDLFPGRLVGSFSHFRVTRHSDLSVDEEDVTNLRTALRQGLQQRHFGQAVRLEVSAGCSPELSDLLLRQFDLPPALLYRVPGPVNLVRLAQLIDLVDQPGLLFPPFKPAYPEALSGGGSILERLRSGDVLIHQPYESFEGVIDFLREAVEDPQVLAIKQTIYRTGGESVMMDLLADAVRRGKEVTAVVELKARFDEEANINWAERLESIGAQVVYGVVGLKTHAKMLLVTRREGRSLRRYGHLSTGNYNPRTARLYTDLSMLTADAALTAEMDRLFVHIASPSRQPRLRLLVPAPTALHRRLLAEVDAVRASAERGHRARIVVKTNALTDETLIHALIQAAQAGASIDLIVRGACMLPAGLREVGRRIRVRSVIGRLLEHSRVFLFQAGDAECLLLSSADWMSRNMFRRIELAWPVQDARLRARIIEECLDIYLHDRRDAWELGADGLYHLPAAEGARVPPSAQTQLLARYAGSSGRAKSRR